MHMIWMKIILLGLAHALNHSFLLAVPVLLNDISKSLGVEIYDMGYMVSLSYFLYGFGSIFAGPLSMRFKSGQIIFLSLFLSGVFMIPLLFNLNVHLFALLLALNSFWASLYHPIANKLISEDYPEDMGKVMGLHGLGGSFCSAFIPIISVAISNILGWKFSFVTLGIASMIISLTFYGSGSVNVNLKSKVHIPYGRIKWIILFSIFLGLSSRGLELYLPSLLIFRGFDTSHAALIMSLSLFAGVLGQIFGGYIADYFNSIKALLTSFIMVFISLIFIVFGGGNNILTLIGVLLYGFSFYAHQPPSTKLQSELVDVEVRGYVYGLFFCINFSLGSASSVLASFLANIYGLVFSYMCLSIFVFISLLITFAMFFEYSKLYDN